MITQEHPEFFRVLSGGNAPLYESIIVSLYDEIYRGSAGEVLVTREYLRNLIYKEMKGFDKEWLEREPSDSGVQATIQATMNRFLKEGWIEQKYDSIAMDHILNFTRMGRKIAQVLHQTNSKYLTTRHRNVRTTLSFLETYRDKGDPYDLIDAFDASDYIVSDLMDQINEVHDVRKNLVQLSIEDLQVAGENFFEFLEKDFRASISVHLTEDSISRYASRINSVVNDIMSDIDTMGSRDKHLIERYPNLADMPSPVEYHLIQIYNRTQSARDHKIPELLEAIESLFKNSEMVLKQAGSIMAKSTSSVKVLASMIRESSAEDKDVYLQKFAKFFNLLGARHLDPERIEVKKRAERRSIQSVVKEQPVPSPEKLRELRIRDEIRKAIGYSSVEVEEYLLQTLKEEDSVINAYMPIEKFKDLTMSLHAAAVALKSGEYKVETDGSIAHNRYYSVDKYTITKKDKQ